MPLQAEKKEGWADRDEPQSVHELCLSWATQACLEYFYNSILYTKIFLLRSYYHTAYFYHFTIGMEDGEALVVPNDGQSDIDGEYIMPQGVLKQSLLAPYL